MLRTVQNPVPVLVYKPRRGPAPPGRPPPLPPELLAPDARLSEDDYRLLTEEGSDCWVLMTYHRLRAAGFEVELSERPLPGRMCIVHYDHLLLREVTTRSFIVAIQPDRPRPRWCDLRIVQNPVQVRGPRDHLLPLWPQPGLLPRDAARPPAVRALAYFGRPDYLASAFHGSAFHSRLAQLGCTLRIVADAARWHDYRETDAVLAVRDISPFDLSIKPPSKLVNAWLAGCIPLLGPEPAYRALRWSALDFIEVVTPQSVLDALARLNVHPEEVLARIRHGQGRAQEFTVDAVTAQWAELLSGPLRRCFFAWSTREGPAIRTRRSVAGAAAIVAHKYERRRFRRLIRWTPAPPSVEPPRPVISVVHGALPTPANAKPVGAEISSRAR